VGCRHGRGVSSRAARDYAARAAALSTRRGRARRDEPSSSGTGAGPLL